jgi:lysophospholipase L1-like esterase
MADLKESRRARLPGRHRHLIGPLIALAATVVALLAIELFLFYVLDIKCPGYRPDRFIQYSLLTGGIHKPHARGYWYRYNDGTKFFVSINSYGFSDSERDLEKTRPRIALIGDSTTEFWEAAPKDRGQYVIEEMLDGRYEVLNFGVRGYATDQVLILFDKVVSCFSPDIVVYTFCVNDISHNGLTQGKPYFVTDPADPDRLLLRNFPVRFEETRDEDNRTLRALDDFFKSKSFLYRRSRGLLMGLIGYHHPLETHVELRPYKRDYDDEDTRRMDITLRLIGELQRSAEDRGMRFLLVEGIYRPTLDMGMRQRIVEEYGDLFDFEKVTEALKTYAVQHGIEFLSLPEIARDRGIGAAEVMHPEDNLHLDKRGIRLFAVSVTDRLRALGWLEEPLTE